jgi:hypothetical protein
LAAYRELSDGVREERHYNTGTCPAEKFGGFRDADTTARLVVLTDGRPSNSASCFSFSEIRNSPLPELDELSYNVSLHTGLTHKHGFCEIW